MVEHDVYTLRNIYIYIYVFVYRLGYSGRSSLQGCLLISSLYQYLSEQLWVEAVSCVVRRLWHAYILDKNDLVAPLRLPLPVSDCTYG